MRVLVSAEEMKKYDNYTIETLHMPALVLMERAALETFRVLEETLSIGKTAENISAFLLAGYGNNGGDGLALARLLCDRGAEVEIMLVGSEEKATSSWKTQRQILEGMGACFVTKPSQKAYSIIIDALFGVGLSRAPEGLYAQAIRETDSLSGLKLAMDIPSGVLSDNGAVPGEAFHADITVTYGFEKRGLYLFPGCTYAGEILLRDVGIPERSLNCGKPEMFCLDETMEELMPKRRKDGNKGTFGKALVIAGSHNMAGAAILCARACYRMGVGMVKILTPPCNREIVQKSIPEALLGTFDDLRESVEWCDTVCIGPGLGTGEEAFSVLSELLSMLGRTKRPVVTDADALNLIASHPVLMEQVKSLGKSGNTLIMTPHPGELTRLLKGAFGDAAPDMDALKKSPWVYALKLSELLQTTIAAKDARTFVCRAGKPVCMNIAGNSGMATAGSGDVLAGILTALLAAEKQDENPDQGYTCACRGVRIHALAGDAAAQRLGEHSVMAGDLIENLR